MATIQKIDINSLSGKILDKARMPIIFHGLSRENLSISTFYNDFAETEIPVEIGAFKIFRPRPTLHRGNYYRKMMSVSDFAKSVERNFFNRTCFYISSLPLSQYFPEIEQKLPSLSGLTSARILNKALFLGPDKTGTYFHYDLTDNLIVVFEGTKSIYILPPSSTKQLKPFSVIHNCCKFSSVVPDQLDAFPLEFKKLSPAVCDIGPGEALFLPCGWWHYVENDGHTLGVSYILSPRFCNKHTWSYLRVKILNRFIGRFRQLCLTNGFL